MNGQTVLLLLLLVLAAPSQISSFSSSSPPQRQRTTTTQLDATRPDRRTFFKDSVVALVGVSAGIGVATLPPAALADDGASIPMITSDQFDILLRDSARSIKQVEFSGPRSETVTVRLMDGTAFGIKDVVESSVDPRSPLKISAACRENLVPTKFVSLEAALASAPRKKKLYTNERVMEAAEKEKEKRARMQRDEDERLAALFKMEQEEEARKK